MSQAADRLIKVHNVRAFEMWLANTAASTQSPCFAWASATVAAPHDETVSPVVVVMVGLKRKALLALGVLHVLAWWRVRRTLGRTRQGYRVHVRFA